MARCCLGRVGECAWQEELGAYPESARHSRPCIIRRFHRCSSRKRDIAGHSLACDSASRCKRVAALHTGRSDGAGKLFVRGLMTFFFKKTLGLRSVDAGHGWLIFGVPAAEVAFHSHDENNRHEMYFMCDDIKAQVAAL